MNPEQQRIALCEWAGWRMPTDAECAHRPKHPWRSPDDGCCYLVLPSTNSLDVLHEMEGKLNDVQQRLYAMFLHELARAFHSFGRAENYWLCIHTTAAQRREALLKTLGLWREDK